MKNMQKLPKEDFILDATCKTYKKPEYNGLFDPNLSSFFASPRRRKLLVVQRLVSPIQILPNGQINEKECKKKITSMYQTSNPFKKSNINEITQVPIPRKSKSNTPNIVRTLKLSEKKQETSDRVHPVTSNEFKEMLSKRRELLKDL